MAPTCRRLFTLSLPLVIFRCPVPPLYPLPCRLWCLYSAGGFWHHLRLKVSVIGSNLTGFKVTAIIWLFIRIRYCSLLRNSHFFFFRCPLHKKVKGQGQLPKLVGIWTILLLGLAPCWLWDKHWLLSDVRVDTFLLNILAILSLFQHLTITR